MTEVELDAWKVTKKTEAYEAYLKGECGHDEYMHRLELIDAVKYPGT